MKRLLQTLLICLLAPAAIAPAQETPKKAAATLSKENPISDHNRFLYGGVKAILLATAEKMPEENYSFKPTDVVRTFGQIIGHVADSQYNFCSRASGEKGPALHLEKTKTSKADLIAALKDSFAYCDKVYNGLTDTTGGQTVKLMGSDAPKLGVLTINNVHTIEHYGNLVTYMRMKDIVPPTSDQEFMKTLSRN